MKKRFLAFLLATISALCLIFAGCGDKSNTNNPPMQKVDYAAQAKLDFNDNTSLKQKVTVVNYIDGDTTHFNVPSSVVQRGILKARYLAVNTPESTGKIEEWGKKASRYTREKLSSAKEIYIETNGTTWETDSTGDRHLVWVWYKTAEMTDYRCLNIELLQEGLAFGSSVDNSRYGTICRNAIDQSIAMKLYVFSDDLDPDYYYGAAHEIDLKELRLNTAKYLNERVAFECYVTKYNSKGIFVQSYDEETGAYYGFAVYYGYFLDSFGEEEVAVGNHVRIVGNVQYYEQGGTYQVADLRYSIMDPNNPDHVKRLDNEYHEPVFTEFTMEDWKSSKTVTVSEINEETGEVEEVLKTVRTTEVALSTTIEMKGLQVVDTYTTDNGGSNDGAISLTCKVGNDTITVRTVLLYDENKELVTEDYFKGKTINVKGVIDYYSDAQGDPYQIKLFSLKDVTFVE